RTCSAGSTATTRRPPRTAGRSSWCRTRNTGPTWRAASPGSQLLNEVVHHRADGHRAVVAEQVRTRHERTVRVYVPEPLVELARGRRLLVERHRQPYPGHAALGDRILERPHQRRCDTEPSPGPRHEHVADLGAALAHGRRRELVVLGEQHHAAPPGDVAEPRDRLDELPAFLCLERSEGRGV